jgi:hypothetical protein
MSPIPVTLLIALIAVCTACARPAASTAPRSSSPEEINFLSIVVDRDTAAADIRLKRFLERAVAEGPSPGSARRSVRFQQQTMPYGDVIRAFTEPDPSRGYLARITPYAYVAAEMLGAKLSILAVYRSAATNDTTYHSYFVVRKDRFQQKTKWKPDNGEASLDDVVRYLRSFVEREPARFMYHDRFSTSSYFMPSLYFRANDVFAMTQSLNERLTPIRVERLGSTSSTDLVHQIRDGRADLVAVWDGTKKKFENADDLLFIRIPTAVPNDFLVASGISETTQQLIVDAISRDPAAGRVCTSLKNPQAWPASAASKPERRSCQDVDETIRPRDDFDGWYAWDAHDSEVTDAAREALAKLRQDARQQPRPVVVRVQGRPRGLDPREDLLLGMYVDAAKEAVRLSGTEFVLEDRDLHKRVDMTWTLESTHDGALKLRSELDSAFRQSEETFAISFIDTNDLPRRIADLARSRLRRVRYVWPYEQKYPAVLRDLDFTPNQKVLVQRISWMDATRNEYEEDTPFEARVENNTDFSKLRLSDEVNFPRNPDGSFNFDPMSNIAYRVIIAREPQAGWIWAVLPYFFIGLFALAGAGLAVDLRRRQPPPKGLHQTYDRMVEAYHRTWRGQDVEEGQILWCDSKYMDDFVKELKSAGSLLDVVQAGGCDFNLGPLPLRFSVLMKLGSRLFKRRPQLAGDLAEAAGIGCVAALDTLMQFVVCRRRLSPFVGLPERGAMAGRTPAWPIEWEALNDITSRHFQRLGICDKAVDAHFGAENSALAAAVSAHFRGVIRKATHQVSLFCQTWNVLDQGAPGRLTYEGKLRTALQLPNQDGPVAAQELRIDVTLPPNAVLAVPPGSAVRAWVFGRILTWSVQQDILSLQVKPIAILRDYAHQH